MNKRELSIIEKEFNWTIQASLQGFNKDEELTLLRRLMDNLGLKDNRYKIENREIMRYKEYNYIVKESFNSIYEDFKKYGYYTIMDIEEIEWAFDELKYMMTDEEVKCNKARIRNIKENIK